MDAKPRIRKADVVRVLSDAMDDRAAFADASGPGTPAGVDAVRERGAYRALLARYRAEARVALSEGERSNLRLAAIRALSWRRELLDSYAHMPRDPQVRAIRSDIRQADAVLSACGGAYPDPTAEGRLVSVDEIAREGIGTHVRLSARDGVERREISENGAALGTVETEADGTVRVTLADGKIVNRHFRDASRAQDWLLARFSDNPLFAWRRKAGHDVDGLADDDAAIPRP
jgi:hypothetical protein